MTTEETNVIPFKNVGVFIEELTQFASTNGGKLILHVDENDLWTLNLHLDRGRVIAKNGESLVAATLSMYRAATKLANGE